jgi:hypothetical protein
MFYSQTFQKPLSSSSIKRLEHRKKERKSSIEKRGEGRKAPKVSLF